MFAESGRRGFTVTAVTDAGGVSLGSLYHHFGSFDGLAAHLYLRCLDQLCDTLSAALGHARTPRTGLRAFVQAYLRFIQDHRDVALFLHTSAYAETVGRARAERFAVVTEWLRPHFHAHRIESLPTPLLDVLVIGPVEETARRWLAGTHDIDLDEAARILPDRIWRALRPDPAYGKSAAGAGRRSVPATRAARARRVTVVEQPGPTSYTYDL